MIRRTFLSMLMAIPLAVKGRIFKYSARENIEAVGVVVYPMPSHVVMVAKRGYYFGPEKSVLVLELVDVNMPGHRFRHQMPLNIAVRNGLLDVEIGDFLRLTSDGTFAKPSVTRSHGNGDLSDFPVTRLQQTALKPIIIRQKLG